MKKHCTLLVLISIVFLPFSCGKIESPPPSPTTSVHSYDQGADFRIEDARKWYEQSSLSARTQGENQDKLIWGDGIERKVSSNQSIVVVPLLQANTLDYKIRDGP